MIHPTRKDLGRKVRTRDYKKTDAGVVGSWVEGRIDTIGKMSVVVEFGDGCRDLCRSDLEFVE